MSMKIQGNDGKFIRQITSWTPENWNVGYLDNRGYFRIYRPDYPKAYSNGYAKRYHVVWWLATGKIVPADHDLHHKNSNKQDDRFENLELIGHREHGLEHNRRMYVNHICFGCGRTFTIRKKRLSGEHAGKFCSQSCYHKTPRTGTHKQSISAGLATAYREGRR